ncbi:reverse transcriptase domain-containing protein [Tanacetum coccineum]
MTTYLKNMAGWKPKDLKNKSFANVYDLFEKAMKRIDTFVDMDTELVEGNETREEESSKRAGDELEQENAKKKKVDDDQETAEFQSMMKIVPDEEEVAVDAIPLATKPPSIRYSSMIHMLKSFYREDLETLWKLVKAKHGYTGPEEGYERVLSGDLKKMFEHHVEDAVWRNLQGNKIRRIRPIAYDVLDLLGTAYWATPVWCIGSLGMAYWLFGLTRRTVVKGQILADFLIEKPETDTVLPQSEVTLPEPWILFTDGSSCVDGSSAGLILTNPEGMEFTYALRFEFTAMNNEAEYEALLAGLRIAARMGVRNLEANVDSRLVANHVLGEYVAKEDNMIQYLDKTKSLIQGFDRFTIRQVPRGDNKKADALSKIASTSFAHLSKQVLVEILKNKSISEMEISTVIEEQDPTWMTPIVEFISKGTLPHEQKDARRIRRTAQRFELRER